MTKAIFTSYQQYALQYAKELVSEYGWEPLYFFTVPSMYEDFKRNFPNAILHDYYDSIKCIFPAELKDLVCDPIDPQWLDEFAVHESISLNMMERNDPTGTFRYQDRLKLYHDLIRYWKTVLTKLAPDYIVFEEEPHEVSDYVMYIVAQKLGIKCILFLRLPFFRMYPVLSFEEGSPVINNAYREKLQHDRGEPVVLEESIAAYLDKIRSEYDIKKHLYNQTEGLKKLTTKESVSSKVFRKTFHYLKVFNILKFPKRVRAVLDMANPAANQEIKSRHADFRKSQIKKNEYYKIVDQTRAFKAELRQYYNSLTQKAPDLDTPFILYALNFQPERTTSPIGGHFVNQLLAIELIAKNLPKGWKLYVKEHPSQFIHVLWGDTFRSKEFYNEIAAIPNVELVPLIYDIYNMIDHSRAIATVTGTMAWEAVVREKPAIIFGHTWYKKCEGILYIDSEKKMKEAIGKVQSGYKPDFHKVKLFAKTLEEHSYKAFVGGAQEQLYSYISHDENAKAHIQAIKGIIH